jgi:hypothetical protein
VAGQGTIAWPAADRFSALPLACGNAIDPGIVASDDWRDWSDRATTVDQRRIENYLDRFSLAGKRILHVGIGNSGLARRFARRADEVVGISIDARELTLAQGLGLANYVAVERNKYAGLGDEIVGRFDFIIDNNINSACCCLSHLRGLLEEYCDRLTPCGQILTDKEGLAWIPEAAGLNPRWRFSLEDLACAADLTGLTTEAIGSHLAALSRGDRAQPTLASRTSSLLRRTPPAVARRLKRLRNRLARR